ncbi:MAG: hypothetical protein GPJ54_20540 [Candidatus Heimdallarchaeota archaeon]|nr:hypothetical protein [Candidatus Heimdallarchaeota archaeon]
MYKHKFLTSLCLLLLLNTNPTLAAEEFDVHYSADLRIGSSFQWRVDNFAFHYSIDTDEISPTNVLYSEEVYQSGILYFPVDTGVPAEVNGSIFELTVNEDIDLVSSFDQIIFSFDYSVTLDDVVLPKIVAGLDVSKPLFNFFMQPSSVVFENESRFDYFEFLGFGSVSYEESLDNIFNRLGFYPTRISQLSSFVSNGIFVEHERTADCIAEGNQPQTCDNVDKFVEITTVTRTYDVTSGKLLKYDYTEDRRHDPTDRLYPSTVMYNLTNIDPTTGSGPEIPVLTIDEDSLDIPQAALYASVIIVVVFIAVIGYLKYGKKSI